MYDAIIQVLPFLNNPQDLDPSYKMDIDFWNFLEGKNSILEVKNMVFTL